MRRAGRNPQTPDAKAELERMMEEKFRLGFFGTKAERKVARKREETKAGLAELQRLKDLKKYQKKIAGADLVFVIQKS
jgi:hypothetical protein